MFERYTVTIIIIVVVVIITCARKRRSSNLDGWFSGLHGVSLHFLSSQEAPLSHEGSATFRVVENLAVAQGR